MDSKNIDISTIVVPLVLVLVVVVLVVLLVLWRRAALRRRKELEPEPRNQDLVKEYHDLYIYHGRVLRTWLVAYGVGAPAVLLTRDSAWNALREYENAPLLAGLFFLGVLAQVVITLVNKTVNWLVYNAEDTPDLKKTSRWWDYVDVLSEQYWLDVLADVVSIVSFIWATAWLITRVLFSAS